MGAVIGILLIIIGGFSSYVMCELTSRYEAEDDKQQKCEKET